MDPREPDDRGPSPAQRPPSVVTTSRSNSMSATTPAACPGRTCGGPGSTCSFPCSPAHRRAPGAGPAPMVGQAASAAPQPVHMPSGGPGLASRLVRAAHCQRPTILPRQADSGRDDQAAHRPQRHVEPGAPTVAGPGRTDAIRIQRGADSAAAAGADTGRLSVRTPGSHRWCGHWSPWTPDIRPTSWTDVRPHGGQRTRTQQRTAWPASGHPGRPRRRRPPAERRKASLGLQRLRRSAPHDGSAVPTLAAAVIGQLRSTARHDAAPWRTALVCWIWMVRGEGNGTTEGEVCRVRLVGSADGGAYEDGRGQMCS